MATSSSACDPRLPRAAASYCAEFTPATLALICDAGALQLKLGCMANIDCGFVWAAVRAIERGEASSSVLGTLTAEHVEETYRTTFRELPRPVTIDQVEKSHGMNMLTVLPPRCRPNERRLDFANPVTPGVVLAEIIAKFDYSHAANAPLRKISHDMKGIAAALAKPGGFSPGDALKARGTIPENKIPLYRATCAKAEFIGTWLVRDFHVAAAACDLGLSLESETRRMALLEKWERELSFAHEHLSEGGCVWLVSFPGPRPWAPSACLLLGVESAVDDIYGCGASSPSSACYPEYLGQVPATRSGGSDFPKAKSPKNPNDKIRR